MKKTNNSAGLRFGIICAGVAMCVVGARCARAQNALGDGTALDRNLRVGSGGKNEQVRDINALIRFNNSVVTGNAGGGRSFRGNAGYLATDDFRAATGSDAIFNFRRDAESASAVSAGIRGTDALQYQFALTTGQRPPAVLGNFQEFGSGLSRGPVPMRAPGVVADVAGDATRRLTSSTSAGALRSTADFNAQQAIRPTVLGMSRDREGRDTVLTASPLTGVKWSTAGAPAGQETTKPAPGTTKPGAPPLSGLESVPSYISNPMGLVQSVTSMRIDTRVPTPKAVMTELERTMDESIKKSASPNPAVPSAQGTPNAPQSTVWEQEMDRIRKHLRGEPDDAKPSTTPGDENTAPEKRTVKSLIDLETGKLNTELLKAMQSSQTTLKTLTPDEPEGAGSYAEHMRRGELLLSQSKYFDAEDAFVRALAAQPTDPLASVGRVHSELGAGLFLSSMANLRAFYSERPEMLGTRYAPSLLPTTARMDGITRQLRMNISDKTSGVVKESGMLLAYIGHQLADRAMVKEGLDAMASATYPEQTTDLRLLGVLQKVWLERPATTPPPAAPAPAPAPTPVPAGDTNK